MRHHSRSARKERNPPVRHLREWLRRLIDEPTDINLEAMIRARRSDGDGAVSAARDRVEIASLSTLRAYTANDQAVVT